MIFSTFNEFKKNLKKKNFSQIYAIKTKPKLETIEKLIKLVSLNKDSFIFESVEKVKIRGRYTIFGFNPDLMIETKNNRIIQNTNNRKITIKKNPYNYLNKLINNFHFKTSKKLPMMSAMLAGYFGYDIIRFKEKIPNNCKDDLKIPDVKLIRPQLIIIHDNEKNKIFFIQNIYSLKNIKNLKKLYLLKCDEINKFIAKINNTYNSKEYLNKKKKKRVQVPIYKVIHHHETTASGTEVQILGLHRAGQKASAMTSNTDNVEEEVGMLDVNDPQTAIIIAQYLQAFQGNSVLLGTYIQQEFSSQGRTDRGVKQMGLEVLAGSAMPGVLVECGFINNPSEEEYMNSEVGLDEIARAIFNGVRAYKAEIEKN